MKFAPYWVTLFTTLANTWWHQVVDWEWNTVLSLSPLLTVSEFQISLGLSEHQDHDLAAESVSAHVYRGTLLWVCIAHFEHCKGFWYIPHSLPSSHSTHLPVPWRITTAKNGGLDHTVCSSLVLLTFVSLEDSIHHKNNIAIDTKWYKKLTWSLKAGWIQQWECGGSQAGGGVISKLLLFTICC